MVIHKRTRLTPIQREEIYRVYHGEGKKVSELAVSYHVSRPTIYKIIRHGRQRDFSIHKSTNKLFCPKGLYTGPLIRLIRGAGPRWGPDGRP